jgi:hypothetical protein
MQQKTLKTTRGFPSTFALSNRTTFSQLKTDVKVPLTNLKNHKDEA